MARKGGEGLDTGRRAPDFGLISPTLNARIFIGAARVALAMATRYAYDLESS
jgi:hypothetical protein